MLSATAPQHGPKRPLAGMRLSELEALLESRARALEVLRWLHGRSEGSAPRIAKESLERLHARCAMPGPLDSVRSESPDGTTKYLVRLSDGVEVETVRIPSDRRSTICVSSQAGCSRKCRFCATATLGFTRQLSAAEIMAQYMLAAREAPASAPARNVVFMGMGEPMDNLDAVLEAVELLTQAPAPQLSAERVTVSTSGVLPGMVRFLRESKASLALSLNATTEESRTEMMPQTRQWPIAELMAVLREDRTSHPGRVHFIEYVLFEGANDSDEDAVRLVRLLEGVNARVNVIPHNPFPESPYRPASTERTMAFQKRVAAEGMRCLIRWPRGSEVAAACGQLARRTQVEVPLRSPRA